MYDQFCPVHARCWVHSTEALQSVLVVELRMEELCSQESKQQLSAPLPLQHSTVWGALVEQEELAMCVQQHLYNSVLL